VATDVAARGLDIDTLTLVNYDMPMRPKIISTVSEERPEQVR